MALALKNVLLQDPTAFDADRLEALDVATVERCLIFCPSSKDHLFTGGFSLLSSRPYPIPHFLHPPAWLTFLWWNKGTQSSEILVCFLCEPSLPRCRLLREVGRYPYRCSFGHECFMLGRRCSEQGVWGQRCQSDRERSVRAEAGVIWMLVLRNVTTFS